MRNSVLSWSARVVAVLLGVCVSSVWAADASTPHYLITNDDVPAFVSSASFYTVAANGQLTLQGRVLTTQSGIAGGFFGANRVRVLNSGSTECVYMSEALLGEIDGISIKTLTLSGHANGSINDTGSSNGVGLAMNTKYLYASYTDSNTIGTFKAKPGCKLSFVGDTTVSGLLGGVIDAMAVHGNLMVVTYGDGSIESFNLAAGKPVSNGDEQNSTGSVGNTYPNGIDITSDGHFAIFGDTATSTIVEVSDISSGKLAPTVVYRLGSAASASNIMLSPDESLLYISDTQGDKITAAFFDKTTGALTKGCVSGRLKGYVTNWSYLGGLGLRDTTGSGGMVYATEFGGPSSIAMIQVTSAAGKCTLKEAPASPISDPNSPGLLSIGTFPPRAF
jgi:hypothetical protein